MTRQYRILVLTDHIGHSDQNSIYSILTQMLRHPSCHSIDIASRGLQDNAPFFNALQIENLLGCQVNDTFCYSETGASFTSNLKKLQPEEYDIVLMRIPRPISDAFLEWLEIVFSHAVMINKPSGILKTSNKKYLVNFPELCPDVRLCHSVKDILEELEKHPIVLKPLKEYGGKGLLKIEGNVLDDGLNKHDSIRYLSSMEDYLKTAGMLSMKYLKNVSEGDKRILVVGGEILAASLRMPAEGSWLCNVAQGGRSVPAEVTPKERTIIESLNPKLTAQGIIIYGADTLVDDNGERILSEINTLSIGGFPQAEAQTGKPIIKTLLNKIFDYADEWTK